MVKNISLSGGSHPRYFKEYNGKLYLWAVNDDTGGGGVEPWVTDGTEAGTHILKDINPTSYGLASGGSQAFTVCINILYFVAQEGVTDHQLWSTRGTVAGPLI